MDMLTKIRRDIADERGATIVEFAIVLPVFTMMIFGFLDFAHWSYMRAATSGALESVARSAGVGGPAVDPALFESQVETQVQEIAHSATLEWDKKSYFQFSGIGKPEKLTSDVNGNNQYDAGDCWEDQNPNGTYDTEQGEEGVGGADDIIFYKVTVSYDPLMSLFDLLPWLPETRTVTASTIVKRQPFAAQTVAAIRC